MIPFLRHLCLDDFWLKLFSMALAILIWLTVTFASQKDVSRERVFSGVPVQIVSATADVRNFQAMPDRVDITVKGDVRTLENLQLTDLRARVDLTGMETARNVRKPVEIAAPAGVMCLKAAPQEIQVSGGLNVTNQSKQP